jgi:hypothetical protein
MERRLRREGNRGDLVEACRMDQDIDTDRIDDAALALLWLGLHDGWRTWKGFDWDVMDRLHRKDMISDPVGKAKSVVFTEKGQREAERLFQILFSRRS